MKLVKFALLFLIISMIVVSFSPAISFAVNVAPLFNVDISPINAGSNAEYRIYGSYSDYNKINKLKVYFRADTSFMSPGASAGSVLVNGASVLGTQFKKIESDGSVEATLYLSKYINKGDNIEILFKKEAGIINPITPATCYKIKVVLVNYLNAEVDTILSNNYRITSSAVQGLNVKVDPPVKGMKAWYVISFVTGARGALSANSGEIRIKFPEGTMFPSFFYKSNVLVNNSPVSSVSRDSSDSSVIRVYLPYDVPANYPLTIVFKKEFGLSNPMQAGIKNIFVSTFSEPDLVESEPFEIFEPQIQNLSVVLDPNSIALQPEINITFKTSSVGFLPQGSMIYVEFPQDFYLPLNSQNGTALVNGNMTSASVNGSKIEIVSQESIMPISEVQVKIPVDFGIKNPTLFGEYTLNVWTDADSFKSLFKVNIEQSVLSQVSLSALYSGFNTVNEFKITFKTGPVYILKGGDDRVIVKFDEGFVFPDFIEQELISVNGNVSPTVVKDVYSLYITTPSDILPNTIVEVKIPEVFDIKNPETLGEYGVKVSTTKETEEVASNRIKITPLPVVEFTVDPQNPDGLNGFYKTAPEVKLSTSNGTNVFYKVDEGEFREYTAPFKIGEGIHTVFAYAVDSGNNKGDVVKREFNVDNTPPSIKFDNASSDPYFKGSPGKLNGSVSEPCTLKINEVVLELKENLNFSVELNVSEGMPIAIYARDLAGNAKTLLLTAHIDSIPPVITFVSSAFKLQGTSAYTVETTESSYTIQAKLNEKGKVFVNWIEASFDGFTYTYIANLTDGENQFLIKAVDSAGNETVETLIIKKVNEKKIILQIGNASATVGSETVTLEAAPVIEKGFTLVPLRFIAEAFGANLQWNGELQIIMITYKNFTIQLQVGSTVAFIDNNFVKLDAPPKIINGRTLVPIRFISETFGAEVVWDGATKTVTIVYKP